MPSLPPDLPDWATDSLADEAKYLEPTATKKADGYLGERPGIENANWFWQNVYLWWAFLKAFFQQHERIRSLTIPARTSGPYGSVPTPYVQGDNRRHYLRINIPSNDNPTFPNGIRVSSLDFHYESRSGSAWTFTAYVWDPAGASPHLWTSLATDTAPIGGSGTFNLPVGFDIQPGWCLVAYAQSQNAGPGSNRLYGVTANYYEPGREV